jgi:hypothetical protein
MEPLRTVAELLPAHLGWESDNLLGTLHGRVLSSPPTPSVPTKGEGGKVGQDTAVPSVPTLAIFGHLLDRLLQRGQVGTGRVWLLLRHFDRQRGEGRVSLALARHLLTGQHSRYRCLSWKRLRQLLQEGEGVFWHWDKTRTHLYYHSEARVAQELGLAMIRGWAVQIPVPELCQSIKKVRAVFYDAFHSARGDGFQRPITRRTLNERGSGDKRTQRGYEKVRGMGRQAQLAQVGRYSKLAWRQAQAEDAAGAQVGGPAFIFVDYKGLLGVNPHREKRAAGKRHWHHIYIMRQIGNAYAGTLRTVKRGRMWTNRKLKHLCNSILPTGSFVPDESPTVARMYYEEATAVSTPSSALPPPEAELPRYWRHPLTATQPAPTETEAVSGYWQEATGRLSP